MHSGTKGKCNEDVNEERGEIHSVSDGLDPKSNTTNAWREKQKEVKAKAEAQQEANDASASKDGQNFGVTGSNWKLSEISDYESAEEVKSAAVFADPMEKYTETQKVALCWPSVEKG